MAPAPDETAGFDWTSNGMIALYIALGVAIAGVITWLATRGMVRTRIRTEKEIRDDPDIHDWLVVFGWSRKVLYVPTLAVSLLAALVMLLHTWEVLPWAATAEVIGGVWFAVFFLNLLVEEFQISAKVVLIAGAAVLALFLWLHLLGWVGPFLRLFRFLGMSINWVGFLALAVLGGLTILVSWIKGLFYYVAFTPNYLNIQWGLAESGDHIGREDYNTHIDTEDVLERLMGFGKIIIVDRRQQRPPVTLLVWRIGRKAELLERVRGKFAIDSNHHAVAGAGAPPPQAPAEPADAEPPGEPSAPTGPTDPSARV